MILFGGNKTEVFFGVIQIPSYAPTQVSRITFVSCQPDSIFSPVSSTLKFYFSSEINKSLHQYPPRYSILLLLHHSISARENGNEFECDRCKSHTPYGLSPLTARLTEHRKSAKKYVGAMFTCAKRSIIYLCFCSSIQSNGLVSRLFSRSMKRLLRLTPNV